MISYILQVILFQLLFLIVYDLFLSKETFFVKNRWYLLSTHTLSFLIPFLKISTIQKVAKRELTVFLPELTLSPEKVITESKWYASFNYIEIIFAVGVFVFTLLFVKKLYSIIQLIKTCKKEIHKEYVLIILPNKTKAFSFLHYIFLGNYISKHQKEKIIEHELVHCKQKHSLDLLFFEIIKIIMWFNPLIYFYQKRITLLHEYITDAEVLKKENRETYINNLLSHFFQVENTLFVNQFYKQTLIKKRIIMMKKNQSQKVKQLKYLALVPALTVMLVYTSCSEEKLNDVTSKNELNLKQDAVKTKPAEVSFNNIDKAPTFPGCKSGDKTCFQKEIKKYFSEKFNDKLPNQLDLESGEKRLFVAFKINKNGDVVDIKARAPHLKIEEEAIRTLATLPKMLPAKKEGESVEVRYVIPFTFKVS